MTNDPPLTKEARMSKGRKKDRRRDVDSILVLAVEKIHQERQTHKSGEQQVRGEVDKPGHQKPFHPIKWNFRKQHRQSFGPHFVAFPGLRRHDRNASLEASLICRYFNPLLQPRRQCTHGQGQLRIVLQVVHLQARVVGIWSQRHLHPAVPQSLAGIGRQPPL